MTLATATIFKKIRFNSHDNIGSGPITLPPEELHTSSTWLSFDAPLNWNDDDLSSAMTGVAYAMNSFIPLYIQSDRSDVHVVPQVKATHNGKSTFFVYDRYPGGIGLSERIYDLWEPLLDRVYEHVDNCSCQHGCPSCIGAQDLEEGGKKQVKCFLETVLLRG